MTAVVSLLNDLAVGVFGSVLSAWFCNALTTPRNRRVFWGFMAVLPLLQGWVYFCWGAAAMQRAYPLVVHLPLTVVLALLTHTLLWPAVSVLTAYLCCELRRWMALLIVALLAGGEPLQDALELAFTVPLLLLLLRFAAPAVRELAGCPARTQLQFGVIPALYYGFDYLTRVYTELLQNGDPAAVEFMPFVCCTAYLAFLLYHSAREQEQNRLQQAQKSLDIQLGQSVREIAALRESQTLTRQYRHDVHHLLQYLSACIENGQTEQAQAYISGICAQIEAQKVTRYCENEAANLILSSFAARAKKEGAVMQVAGALPAAIPLPDSDLCVLLSNALENALHACRPFAAAGEPCVVDVQFYERAGKLFLQVTNPCGPVRFENGLPVSDRPGHGVGVQSICAIVQRYGGVYAFLVRDGRFILRLSL